MYQQKRWFHFSVSGLVCFVYRRTFFLYFFPAQPGWSLDACTVRLVLVIPSFFASNFRVLW